MWKCYIIKKKTFGIYTSTKKNYTPRGKLFYSIELLHSHVCAFLLCTSIFLFFFITISFLKHREYSQKYLWLRICAFNDYTIFYVNGKVSTIVCFFKYICILWGGAYILSSLRRLTKTEIEYKKEQEGKNIFFSVTSLHNILKKY